MPGNLYKSWHGDSALVSVPHGVHRRTRIQHMREESGTVCVCANETSDIMDSRIGNLTRGDTTPD